VGWTDDGREFLALARESRFLVSLDLLFPRSLSLVSIDHRGRTRERLDLGRRRFVSVESLDQPDLYLLITEADGVGSLLVLDAGRVNVTEVAAGPADSYPDVRFTPEGLLVRFGDATGLLSAWLVGDDPYDPVPIPVARESTRSLPDVILDGALHSRTGESASALLDQLSQPVHANADEGGPARGIYMIPSLVRDDTPIFYVETKLEERYAELFLRRPVDERWTRVATRIPARSQYFDTIRGIPDKNMIATHALGNLDGLAITQLGEIAVFVSEQEGLYQVGLHDARRGRQLELAQLIRTEPNRIPEVRLRRIPDIDGWLVGLRYGETHTFRYDPASGELEEISEFSRSIELTQDPAAGGRGARLAWFYSWPSLRYRDARGVEIHEVDGKLIRLTPDGHREVLYGD
jgi:hypothetical protein